MNPLDLLSPDLRAAIEALIDERIAAALAAQPNPGPPWLTLAEAADYAHVSPRTLARLVASGKLPASLVGSRRIVNRDDLDAMLGGTA